jgi:hypothetical protein
LAKAAYQAHLDSFKHRECARDEDGIDLTSFDNKARDFLEKNGSQPEPCLIKIGKPRAPKKKKK